MAIVLVVSLLADVGCGPASEPEVCGNDRTCTTSTPAMPRLNAVFGFNDSDVWAVGDKGYTAHWNGSGWQKVETQVTSQLNGIWGTGSNDLWAVGSGPPVLLHWQGQRWAPTPLPVLVDLYAVCGFAANDIWAVGDEIRPMHWDGQQWQASAKVVDVQGSPEVRRLTSLWCESPQSVWAAGAGVWLHGGTASWGVQVSPPYFYNSGYSLWGSRGTTGSKGWAVADRSPTMRYEAGAWSARLLAGNAADPSLLAIHGRDDSDVWAVGTSGTMSHYDGKDWQLQPAHMSMASLRAVWVSPSGGMWTVGLSAQGFGIVIHRPK